MHGQDPSTKDPVTNVKTEAQKHGATRRQSKDLGGTRSTRRQRLTEAQKEKGTKRQAKEDGSTGKIEAQDKHKCTGGWAQEDRHKKREAREV